MVLNCATALEMTSLLALIKFTNRAADPSRRVNSPTRFPACHPRPILLRLIPSRAIS